MPLISDACDMTWPTKVRPAACRHRAFPKMEFMSAPVGLVGCRGTRAEVSSR